MQACDALLNIVKILDVTVSPWVCYCFAAGISCTYDIHIMRRPSFSSEKEGKTDSRSVLKISRPCAVLSVMFGRTFVIYSVRCLCF